MKKSILPMLAFYCVFLGCSDYQKPDHPKPDSISSIHIAGVPVQLKTAAPPPSEWIYDTSDDKMTSKQIYFASVDAKDLLQLNFPYNGGSIATLRIQHRDGRNLVLLAVTKGQFMASVDPEDMRVRFDNGKAETFYGDEPADHDIESLFISPADHFISKLKKSKRLIIQVEMYNDGTQIMEFDTENLIWKH